MLFPADLHKSLRHGNNHHIIHLISRAMTPLPPPSPAELRARLLTYLEEIRRVLDQTASFLPDDQRGEYQRLRDALDSLDRRIRETFAE